MFHIHRDQHSKGFTILELLIVIAIIGLLSTVIIASIGPARENSRDSLRISQIQEIAKAIDMYHTDNGTYPHRPRVGQSNGAMWPDSRNPPNTGVHPWSWLMDLIHPQYLSGIPIPPLNGTKDGSLMCNNCSRYRYYGAPYGRGYSICASLASDTYKNSQTGSGPTYCIWQNCAPDSAPSACDAP